MRSAELAWRSSVPAPAAPAPNSHPPAAAIDPHPAGGAAASLRKPERAKPAGRRAGRAKVPRRDILAVTTQLAIMIRSGVDLATALESLGRQCKAPALAEVLTQVHSDVSSGVAFSEAIKRHSRVFGETFVASMAAGEASGRLAEVLEQLARLQRGELRLRGSIRTLLGYPVLLASVSALVLFALTFFVLPQFAQIFSEFETPLPVMTSVLLAVATELRVRFWLWGAMVIPAGLGLSALWRSPAGKLRRDRLMVNARVLRDVTRSLLVGRAFRLLGIMLESGVPLVESIRLVRASMSNVLFQDVFRKLEDDVINGRGLESCLRNAEVVPPAAAQMVATAERTGSLGQTAILIADHFEEDGESRLRTAVALLEPAIIIVMGAIVALVVLAVMLPMFDLATVGGRPS